MLHCSTRVAYSNFCRRGFGNVSGGAARTASGATAGPSASILYVSVRRAGFARPSHSDITAALSQMSVSMADVQDAKGFRKTYLDLVRKHHPDTGGNIERMKSITTAHDLLMSLTDSERREYNQRAKYTPSSSTTSSGNKYRQAQQARAQQTQQAYDFQDMYRRHYEDTGSFASRANHSTYQQQAQSNDPYNIFSGGARNAGHGAFSKYRHDFKRLPFTVILFRSIAVYAVVVFAVIVFQRAADDYKNETGWRQANGLAKQDRLQQIYDSRSDFLERLKGRDLAQQLEKDRVRERRVFDYASQRQQELSRMEFQSFPPLPPDGSMGSVFKVPADPLGVLYYEPPMRNTFEANMRGDSAGMAQTSSSSSPGVGSDGNGLTGGGAVSPGGGFPSHMRGGLGMVQQQQQAPLSPGSPLARTRGTNMGVPAPPPHIVQPVVTMMPAVPLPGRDVSSGPYDGGAVPLKH